MSKELAKMNLISVVQQLPKKDIEIIQGYVEMIEEQNQELKEQVEEYKQEKQEWINLLDMFKNQQRKFIQYLEDLIRQNETVVEVSKYGLPKNCSKLLIDFYKEILSKFREIIGGKDER